MRSLLYSLILLIAISRPALAVQNLSNTIVEGSTSYVTVNFVDQNGISVRPNTVEECISETSTNQALVPCRTLIPATPSPTGTRTPLATPGGEFPSLLTISNDVCASRMVKAGSTQTNNIVINFTYGNTSFWPNAGQISGTSTANYPLENTLQYVVVRTPAHTTTPGTETPQVCIVVTPTPTPTGH